MNPYREQIQANDLSYRDQAQLVLALRGHLQDEDERDTARGLLVELRRRQDIVESIARDIDELLASVPAPGAARRDRCGVDLADRIVECAVRIVECADRRGDVGDRAGPGRTCLVPGPHRSLRAALLGRRPLDRSRQHGRQADRRRRRPLGGADPLDTRERSDDRRR